MQFTFFSHTETIVSIGDPETRYTKFNKIGQG